MKIHHKYTLTLIALLVISFPYFSFAFPFGGLVQSIQPCDEGMLLYVSEPTLKGYTMETFMWFEGELPYMMYVIPHPGQWLLGDAGLSPSTCTIDGEPYGEGYPINYHGESI